MCQSEAAAMTTRHENEPVFQSPCGLQGGALTLEIISGWDFSSQCGYITPQHHHTISQEDTGQRATTCNLNPHPYLPLKTTSTCSDKKRR